jgi:hypothetical protein
VETTSSSYLPSRLKGSYGIELKAVNAPVNSKAFSCFVHTLYSVVQKMSLIGIYVHYYSVGL